VLVYVFNQKDLDAAKISIPCEIHKSDEDDTKQVLDLGHFIRHTTAVSI